MLLLKNNSKGQSSVVKRKYKLWKNDPNAKIPNATLRRWAKNVAETEDLSSIVNFDAGNQITSLSPNNSGYSFNNNDNSANAKYHMEEESELPETSIDASNFVESFISDNDNESEGTNNLLEEHRLERSNDVNIEITADDLLDELLSIPLYNNSEMSISESVVEIMSHCIEHRLSKAALKGLVELFQRLFPDTNLPKTEFHLFKVINEFIVPCGMQKFYYCKKCSFFNGKNSTLNMCPSCLSSDGTNFFFELDIVDQIKFLFEKKNLGETLSTPSDNGNFIYDITDGSEYRRVNARNGRDKYDLTLILNTDGISLSKSSKSHCWPLMFTIAEVPEHIRDSFIIIIGIWYDTVHKPSMNTFLYPFCEKLRTCFYQGITWLNPVTNKICNSKVVAPLFIADAPARAQLLNTLSFNGKFGCNMCEIEATEFQAEEGKKKTLIFAFQDKHSALRSGLRMKSQAKKALKEQRPHIKGVKGNSVLSSLPLLDLGTCVVPEYMHSVLLGVVKQLLTLWMTARCKWSIKKNIKDIDQILLAIQPPHFFNRMPRTISDYHHYKASEFYNFLLFYSIPILYNFLPNEYFQHLLLLVISIFTLLKKPITIFPELEYTEILLKLFVRDIGSLYTAKSYTYNVHQLLHLTLSVKRWGPLWASSAFPFENCNNFIANCVHGTKNLGVEMVNNLRQAQAVQALKIQVEHSVLNCSLKRVETHQLFNEINKKKFIDVHEKRLLESLALNFNDLTFYSRAKIKNEIYTSQFYKIVKTNSYTVEIRYKNQYVCGAIKYFIKVENDLFLMLSLFTIEFDKMFIHKETNTIVEHILPIHEQDECILVRLVDIDFISHLIRVNNFVCRQPNLLKKLM